MRKHIEISADDSCAASFRKYAMMEFDLISAEIHDGCSMRREEKSYERLIGKMPTESGGHRIPEPLGSQKRVFENCHPV